MKDKQKKASLKGRTAFLFIHGIGEQNPYETVDFFTHNFINYFDKQSFAFNLEHLIAKRRLSTGSLWTESFVRLKSTDSNEDWLIDVHEYYWSAYTEKNHRTRDIAMGRTNFRWYN